MKPNKLCLITTTLLLSAAAGAGGIDAMMENCNGCHGDNGVSRWTDIPTIAGLPEFVHSDALYVYRDGERPCMHTEYRQGDTSRAATDMCEIASGLSDEQIEGLAAAYSKLPYVMAEQDFDAGLAAKGKAIHDEHCGRCHTEAGTNPDDEAGFLGGQMKGYLASTFKAYAAGEREQPNKMKEKFDPLSGDDLAALVEYYASVR